MISPFTSLQTPQLLHALTTNNPVSMVLLGLSLAVFFVMLGVAITTSRFTHKLGGSTKLVHQDAVVRFPTNSSDIVKEARRG